MSMNWDLLLCCIATLCFYSANAICDMTEDKIQVSEFDVIPGGQKLGHEKHWDGINFSCNFTYQAQGGTKESWLMGLSMNADNTKFSCSVERPGSSSYLFFQSFRMMVGGVQAVGAEVKGSDHSPLNPEEYVMVESSSSVSQVDGKFKSMLGRVELCAVKPKQEL
ncbi:myeloid-derived growth factor-like [Haliotis rubra]|uniref:myeloid-derived growth factor-like n=1 Tax=Haliotis rubra TaxID=36100 RepID=UPI001EE4EDF3|nr:myeloid-derived growth factor-like [Haliotis rubra]